MLAILILLFVSIPIIELMLFVKISGEIGFGPTFGLVILTGVIGAWLARWQGSRVFWRIREQLQSHQLPGDTLIDGAMILVAGVLLITPGILTDAFGFSLLIPPIRNQYRKLLKHWFRTRFKITTVFPRYEDRHNQRDDDNIIDGNVVE
jgi:UPF0716 protein FxsA